MEITCANQRVIMDQSVGEEHDDVRGSAGSESSVGWEVVPGDVDIENCATA